MVMNTLQQNQDMVTRYGLQGLSVKNTFLTINEDWLPLDTSVQSAPAKLGASLDDSQGRMSLAGLDDSQSRMSLTAVAEEDAVELAEPAITTMQIRNIPNRCTREEVLQHVDGMGFADSYDLFHMPMDKKRKSNLGYAFINFLKPETASTFVKSMKGTVVVGERVQQSCKKACTVAPAAVQGVESYIKNLLQGGKHLDSVVVNRQEGIPAHMHDAENRFETRISL